MLADTYITADVFPAHRFTFIAAILVLQAFVLLDTETRRGQIDTRYKPTAKYIVIILRAARRGKIFFRRTFRRICIKRDFVIYLIVRVD